MSGFFSATLWVVLLSFFAAQFIKIFTYSVRLRRLYLRGFFEPGGLPSGHSAVMASLTTMVYFDQGFSSLFFACLFIAFIVMYDAMGVRREVGKHAQVLLALASKAKLKNVPDLREFVGHSPLEVLLGASVGVLVALLFML